MFITFYAFVARSLGFLRKRWERFITFFILKGNNVYYERGLVSNGMPMIRVLKGGNFRIGQHFRMNNGPKYNIIGRQQKCSFVVLSGATLKIGNNVGMSSCAIFCSKKISIGNHVKFGGNTCIYDTDFHSLSFKDRQNRLEDFKNAEKKEVYIGDNVFIGAHTTILKGVNIGENSIIGACSVVTKSIPANQIWAGNPIKFIRNI